jgi:hypothetical protein
MDANGRKPLDVMPASCSLHVDQRISLVALIDAHARHAQT